MIHRRWNLWAWGATALHSEILIDLSMMRVNKSDTDSFRIGNFGFDFSANNINITVTREFGSNFNTLSDFRYVSADILHVRQQPNRSSQIIAKLSCGQPVMLISKGKSWSLVEWTSEEVTIRGWVSSRYLSRFKLKYPN
jgi:uncharacterized protein YgiM (DUF1202 family)